MRELAETSAIALGELRGIYNECHAGRHMTDECLGYVRRKEGYRRMVDPMHDKFDDGGPATTEDLKDSIHELHEALDALQRAVGVNACVQFTLDGLEDGE